MLMSVISYLASFRELTSKFSRDNTAGSLNALFWTCTGFGIAYFYFNKLFTILLRSSRIKPLKWQQTIQICWTITFFAATVLFLFLYERQFIQPQLNRAARRVFAKYKNPLHHRSLIGDDTKFKLIALIIESFYVTSGFLDLHIRDYAEATTKFLFATILIVLYQLGLENFFVSLNLEFGAFYLCTNILLLSALYTSGNNTALNGFLICFRFVTWSYVFLNVVPFKYLIPTLYARDFQLWLNIYSWCWYGLSVWNSPFLQYIYHRIYHTSPADCSLLSSSSRCILLRETPNMRHIKYLQKAFNEIQNAMSDQRRRSGAQQTAPIATNATTAFQTIKCIMLLKRKLRRMRETKSQLAQQSIKDEQPIGEQQEQQE